MGCPEDVKLMAESGDKTALILSHLHTPVWLDPTTGALRVSQSGTWHIANQSQKAWIDLTNEFLLQMMQTWNSSVRERI